MQTNATGILVCCAIPKAIKAALRSSLIVLHIISLCLEKASVSGAHLDPGQTIA